MGQRISSWADQTGQGAHRSPPLRRRYRIESVAVPEMPAVVALMTAVPIASAKARPFTSRPARVAAAGVTTTCATAPASTAIVGRGCDVTGLPSIVAPTVRGVPASTPVNGAVY